MFRMRNLFNESSLELVQSAQRNMEFTVVKTSKAQEAYLRKNSNLYTQDEIETIGYFLDAFFSSSNWQITVLNNFGLCAIASNLEQNMS